MIVANFEILTEALLKAQSPGQFMCFKCSVVCDISKVRLAVVCRLKQSKKTLGQELQEDLNCVTVKTTPIYLFFFSDRAKLLTCRSSVISHKAGIFEILIIYDLNSDNHSPTVSVYCNSFP
jgi:hypothetical protein